MQRLSIPCLCLVALFTASASAESIDTPQYVGWSGWRLGATAITQTKIVADGQTMTLTYTATLKKVDADAVVVDIATTVETQGMKFTSPAAPTTYFAKTPGVTAKETKGRETLTVNGKKLDCEWTEIAGEDGAIKTWTCKDVPGGIVQQTMSSAGSTTTLQLIDWQGQKK